MTLSAGTRKMLETVTLSLRDDQSFGIQVESSEDEIEILRNRSV